MSNSESPKYLLRHGAYANVDDYHEGGVLHWAAQCSGTILTRLLLDTVAGPNLADCWAKMLLV
jgi:ankyrin repeat protein